MHIEVRGLNKHFGSFHAVKDVSFDIAKGHLIGLLGPSGGGKTSVLRMLAGLEQPDAGEILFHGEPVTDLLPQERGIGFVFQNYALFKHMTVFDNIAFGLKVKKVPKAVLKERVMELVELTGLSGFEKRYPHQLSGGSGSASLLPGRWPPNRSCCCWMSLLRPSTPKSGRSCAPGCAS
ncbi:Sulfate/thiosulfate import ATP-binding protein CysA [Paenibacillus sp. P1XP2]|nr:Sulfate/thiosulfate import ATP-binding protein CysA [Paenibacillus sp. P1XP2]